MTLWADTQRPPQSVTQPATTRFGRINIPNSKFYLPYYFDVGGGGLPLTWEIYAGVAYSIANWADLSVGYRNLTFQNGGNTGVRNLSLRGVIVAANFRF